MFAMLGQWVLLVLFTTFCLRQLASARKQSIPFELSCCNISGDVAAVSVLYVVWLLMRDC